MRVDVSQWVQVKLLTSQLAFEFPAEYPFKGPTVHFKCKIHHPNVDDVGGMLTYYWQQLCVSVSWSQMPGNHRLKFQQVCYRYINRHSYWSHPSIATRATAGWCALNRSWYVRKGTYGASYLTAEQYQKDLTLFNRTAAEYTRLYALP